MGEPLAKRSRSSHVGTMPHELRDAIEVSLAAIGQVDYKRRVHKKGPGPLQPRCVAEEDLVHAKVETLRIGQNKRVHYTCSNPKCDAPIRNDKWETHVIDMTTDKHLQEPAEDVLERSRNFAPDGEWVEKESRMRRVLTFMEQRHLLALARQHNEEDLCASDHQDKPLQHPPYKHDQGTRPY